MIKAIFLVLLIVALSSFFWWVAARWLRLGVVELHEGFGDIIIRRSEKPFVYWFNVVMICVVATVTLITSLFLASGLLAGR